MEQTSGKSLALRESVMELFIEQKVAHENRPHFFLNPRRNGNDQGKGNPISGSSFNIFDILSIFLI